MDFAVKEIAPNVWRVDVPGAVRIIRYRPDTLTFAPWDICTEDGRRVWAAQSLESAFRWIEVRTGLPPEVLLAKCLLEETPLHAPLATPAVSQSSDLDEETDSNIAAPSR